MPDAQSVTVLPMPIAIRGSAARGAGIHAALSRSARTEIAGTGGRSPKRAADDRSSAPSRGALTTLLRDYVLVHMACSLRVSEVVAVLGVSERLLRRAVAAEHGVSLAQFITDIRLDQARDWLTSNREVRTQAELAGALGFGSSQSFARAYRQRFGETMSATRRSAVGAGAGAGVPAGCAVSAGLCGRKLSGAGS